MSWTEVTSSPGQDSVCHLSLVFDKDEVNAKDNTAGDEHYHCISSLHKSM